MKTLNVYAINTPNLVRRVNYFNTTLSKLSVCASEKNLKVNIISIASPGTDIIEKSIDEFNKRVQYQKDTSPTADEEFNKRIQPLNIHQISNIEKHRSALLKISQSFDDELHMILEDDVLIGDDYIGNLSELFNVLSQSNNWTWDVLFTCVADINSNPLSVGDSRKNFKFLANKSSYLIKPSTASQLYSHLHTFKHDLKTAISKFVWDNRDINSMVLNRHTLLEGSKVGLFPTSVNNSNFLFQNMAFVQIFNMLKNDVITQDMRQNAEKQYQTIEHFSSPDVLYIMGLMYFKTNNYDKCKEFMTRACNELKIQNGFVSKNSEILNKTIDIFKHQPDEVLDTCKKRTSKYN